MKWMKDSSIVDRRTLIDSTIYKKDSNVTIASFTKQLARYESDYVNRKLPSKESSLSAK